MKTVIGAICLLMVGTAAYFLLVRPSADERLTTLLQDALGPDATLSLNACDLFMTVDAAGRDGSPVALTRVAIRADMRNYNFQTVRFFPGSDDVTLRVDRKPATNAMLEQADDIIGLAGEDMAEIWPDQDGVRDILNNKDGSLFLRVMAEVQTTDGESTLIAHEDAPSFFAFAQSVAALAPPASYQSTTTYGAGGPSADTLLTGEIMAVPHLQFTLQSTDQGKELVHAFYNHAAAQDCT